MAFSSSLKPFVINATDIQFIIDQITFRPLFRANGDIIVAWDGTGAVYDFAGTLLATGGVLPTDQASLDAIASVGSSYQNFTDLSGTRNVSGFWNNLTPALSHYGDTGQIFPRLADANYGNYIAQNTTGAPNVAPTAADLLSQTPSLTMTISYTDGAKTISVIPVSYPGGSYSITYETWNRVLTNETTTTYFADGHHVFVSLSRVDTTTTTQTDFMINDATGTHVAVPGTPTGPVTTTGTVTMTGGELDGAYHSFTTDYALAHQDYTVSAAVPGAAEGNTTSSDGTDINIKNVVDYTPRMISLATTTAGVTFDTWANHQSDAGAADHTANEIYYSPTTGEAVVLDWGKLETVANGGEGQVDTQARLAASAGQDDHFIGGLNPGVSPSNGFFVLFGQFFDHGLDFIDKGQLDANGKNVTIKIALAVDDPLYGMKGPDGQPVTEITINRATVQTVDGQGSEYVNHISPYIDQSQTYGSDAQRTSLLREWVSNDGGATYHAGMELFDGHTLATLWAKPDGTLVNDTLPTLNELRAHIEATGRDALTWEDVSNLRNRDAEGHVVVGTSGEALLLDMNPRFDEAHLLNGMGENVAESQKVLDAVAALDADVKATYGPGVSFGFVSGVLTLTGLTPDPVTGASALAPWLNFSNFSIMQTHMGMINPDITQAVHDAVSDILMASVGDHYIAGDGRANENFGLTSIHHIFHEEHNFQVQNLIDALHRQDIATNDTQHVKLHEFQVDTGHTNSAGDFIYSDGSIAWNEEKVFQGAKIIVEMEYQHAAVDQYARNVSPNIQEFVGYSPDKQPDVTLEYAQVAFRFGHSTLRETIDTIDPTGGITGKIMGYALHDAFLNPEKFGEIGPGSIVLGMSHQQMNEVDEFVTPALNQGLLGQPLDLAAINIARGRDIGMPTLNDFREAIGFARYTSWTDFAQNMQHPSSLVNFIAAYAFDGNMAKAQAIIGLADGSIAPTDAAAMGFTTQQALAFLNGDADLGGDGTLAFNQIDTWLGGLAELHVPGGILGETFDKVFVTQIESLMDGDRFYYLYRLAGQQFGEEVANGQLKDIVERNTGLTHLNGNIFGYADQYVDLGAHKEVVAPGAEALTTGNDHKYGDIADVDNGTIGIYSNGGLNNANDGQHITIGGVDYIQDTRLSADNPLSADYDPNGAHAQNGYANLDGTPNSGAESSEVIVGTKGNDLIYAQGGDDTVYGEGGNDIMYGGYGIDRMYGGAGHDIMYGGDNPDLMDGGSGDDLILGESSGSDINGNDQLIGGAGNDTIDGGVGIDKLSAGSGDDVIYGGQDTDPFTHGGDGNDYVDGGSGGDILYGDNGDDIVVGGADQDQLFGDDGDDILRPGDPTGALTIGSDEVLGGDGVDVNDKGFDLIDFSDNTARPGGVTFDLSNQANPNVTVNGSPVQIPSFQIDGVIGSKSGDTLIGDDATAAGNGSDASIAGENWLIGGSGNDTMTGAGGNDLIVGGSIRLDDLIGRYSTSYDHNNNNDGLTAEDQLQDALYQGASHRVAYDDVLAGGLLEAAGFSKHFTEMLRSQQFKDTVLGDGGVEGTADQATYIGNRGDYTIVALDQSGAVIDDAYAANAPAVYAVKITDRVTNRVDANGVAIPSDGTDLLVGVEYANFNGTVYKIADLYNHKPSGQAFVTSNSNESTSNSNNYVTLTGSSSLLSDADNITAQNPTGAVSNNSVTYKWLNATNAPAVAFGTSNQNSNTAPHVTGANGGGNLVLHATTGLLVDEVATYTDLGGTTETVTTHWKMIVGATGNGSAQNNILTGTSSTTVGDAMFGLGGNDTLNGNGGSDYFNGGTGNDTLNGGSGIDRAVFSGSSLQATFALSNANVLTVTAGGGGGSSGTDTLSSIEAVQFTDGIYSLILGTNGANGTLGAPLLGTSGNDILLGFGGNDVMKGGAGDDIINGAPGTDTAVYTGSVFAATFDLTTVGGGGGGGGGGQSFLRVTTAADGSDTLIGVQTLAFGEGLFNLVSGSNGNNTLTSGTAGRDLILGFGGNDTMAGAGGNDVLDGGTGTDTAQFTGSYTNHVLSFDAAGRVVVQDTANGSPDGTDTLIGIERLQFSNATYALLAGNGGANTITSTQAPQIMIGGDGADTFVFGSAQVTGNGATRDIITDFTHAVDHINVSGIDSDTRVGQGGNQTFTWVGTSTTSMAQNDTAHGKLGYHYETVNGVEYTVVEGNIRTTSADSTSEFQIALRGHLALTTADFFI